MYISCQVREGDLEDFFRHENLAYPPSISENGLLYPSSSKSDLLDCLPMEKVFTSPHVDAMILDGAAMVHIIEPGAPETFRAYAENMFIPSLADRLLTISRVILTQIMLIV